jgi:GNAT superfamily N-acetyltransferase
MSAATLQLATSCRRSAQDFAIRPLIARDIEAVVSLHLDRLTSRLSGAPGAALLRLYYSALARERGGLVFAASAPSGAQVWGIAVLRWGGNRLLRSLLVRHPLRITALLAWQAAAAPSALFELPRCLWERSPIHRVVGELPRQARWCLLHAVAVRDEARGLGTALVEAALIEARVRGFDCILTATFAGHRANQLYLRTGFGLVLSTTERRGGVNWYARPLPSEDAR